MGDAPMQTARLAGLLGAALALASGAAGAAPAPTPPDPGNALTIYNQNFAVVRQSVPLALTAGVNHLTFNDVTAHVEPDSVILRDPLGKRSLQVLEQNYRADPVTQDRLLSLYEGQTIDFQVQHGDQTEIIPGKIIRSGYVPVDTGFNYNQPPYDGGYNNANNNQPIIEVGGKLQFTLPGTPLFPSLPDDSILKPTLDWTVQTDKGGPLNAELAYVTDNMSWKAAYNVVAPETGNDLDITGWVTIDNQSGKTFTNARIKLMAGDVSKLQPPQQTLGGFGGLMVANGANFATPPVTEKAFDEYHLYTLQRPTTLRDGETKQVEFTHATGVHSTLLYVYDGLNIDPNQYNGWNQEAIREQQAYGTQSNPKVWVMREIVNSQANGLGIPLPAGRMRFYRRDTDGQLEFIGENDIDHTPKDETLRVYTGNAFDITGQRVQTKYALVNAIQSYVDESFTITLHNHKATPVQVRVVEHLYRGSNWTITQKSDAFVHKDSRTIEFPVLAPANGDKVVTYTAHYTW